MEELPAEYLDYQTTGQIKMVRAAPFEMENLSEPTSLEGPTVGVLGLWAWKHAERTGQKVCVVNGGVSQSRSGEWLPGTPNYESFKQRMQAALSKPGAYLAGWILSSGLNDAKDVDGAENWSTNTAEMFAGLEDDFGAAPIYLIRYAATVPIGVDLPSHGPVRDAIAAAPFADGIADAPEGPWVEGPAGVHPTTGSNLQTAIRLDSIIP